MSDLLSDLLIPPIKIVWLVIGVVLVVDGDRFAVVIGAVFLALWLVYVARVYRHRA